MGHYTSSLKVLIYLIFISQTEPDMGPQYVRCIKKWNYSSWIRNGAEFDLLGHPCFLFLFPSPTFLSFLP